MYHDPALAQVAARSDPRPVSAVSSGCGVAGMVGMMAWLAFARLHDPVLDGPFAALSAVLACTIPMVLWSVIVDQVHRRPSTGIDWNAVRPWAETREITVAKLVGLWSTWAGIAVIYSVVGFYWQGNFPFAMWCFQTAAPVLFALSIPYLLYFDRRAVEPKDGCYAFGCWLMGTAGGRDHAAIFDHFRAWAVKAFFIAFMVGIVPGGYGAFIRGDVSNILSSPVLLSGWLITFMFMIDVCFATGGYVLTLRPLDSHIRSANPYAAAWMAALICYPPLNEMGLFATRQGTADWTHWFAGHPLLLWGIGTVLVGLTAIYAWATVSFGFRFSNLTHRGIITHGPYAWSKHPAYLSKNVFWFLSTVPVLTTGSWFDAFRATVLMGIVAGIYYWRARTEERHLMADPAYRDYAEWMARNAPIPRVFGAIWRRVSV